MIVLSFSISIYLLKKVTDEGSEEEMPLAGVGVGGGRGSQGTTRSSQTKIRMCKAAEDLRNLQLLPSKPGDWTSLKQMLSRATSVNLTPLIAVNTEDEIRDRGFFPKERISANLIQFIGKCFQGKT